MGIITQKCKECGEAFDSYECYHSKFCCNACRLKSLHRYAPQKRMTGKNFICQECGKEYYVAKWAIESEHGIKYCSPECYFEDKRSKDPAPKHLYSSAKWRKLRQFILERDDHMCQECGEIETLEVHHIISANDEVLRFTPENLITLCHNCHNKAHGRFS